MFKQGSKRTRGAHAETGPSRGNTGCVLKVTLAYIQEIALLHINRCTCIAAMMQYLATGSSPSLPPNNSLHPTYVQMYGMCCLHLHECVFFYAFPSFPHSLSYSPHSSERHRTKFTWQTSFPLSLTHYFRTLPSSLQLSVFLYKSFAFNTTVFFAIMPLAFIGHLLATLFHYRSCFCFQVSMCIRLRMLSFICLTKLSSKLAISNRVAKNKHL